MLRMIYQHLKCMDDRGIEIFMSKIYQEYIWMRDLKKEVRVLMN